ncbi:cytochrome c [Novosphingobium umbonatum]|uniref:Cytochrome c n=1 Tax=Novosphingobium umbonatum TaxID=1908524 RepID=A0A437N7G2_9SPHN|nr:cytochrome c [Novosphingobium umbonatum]RVU05827.1 cytochrome c [Novosphingobium umbonatum]
MKAQLLAMAALVASAPVWAAKPAPKPLQTLHNVSVSIPQDFDQTYPAAAGVEALNDHCRACHSPAMVLVQPRLSAEEWRKEVRKMIDTYKAPVPEDQVEPITRYLVQRQANRR